MTPQLLRVLRKLYKYENSEYDRERQVSLYQESTLSDKERALLREHAWVTNSIVCSQHHNDAIDKLLSLKTLAALTEERIIATFIAGVGGSYLRGRSVLAAWAKLQSMPPHEYEEQPEYRCCWVCSDSQVRQCVNDAYLQYCLYLGNAYSSTPTYAYLNLAYLATQPAVQPTAVDQQTFIQLVTLLKEAPAEETPGQFEKRLTAAKILKGDVHSKRGMLDSLARVGVIPNQFMPLNSSQWADFGALASCEKQLGNTKGRSDMEMPWAGWVGRLGVEEIQLQRLFGAYL